MAIEICKQEIKKNIDAGCDSGLIKGYESLAFLLTKEEYDKSAKTFDSINPRILQSLTIASGKVIGVKNAPENTFDGTTTEYNGDAPYAGKFNKSFAFHVPMMGAGVAKDIIDPLFSGGAFVAILEKKDKSGDGTFEIIGTHTGLRISAGSRDVVNNGYWEVTLTEENAQFGEVVLFDTNYTTTKNKFDAYKALTPA